MNSVHYYKSWFRAKKRALDEITQDEARKAHRNRDLYVAVIGNQAAPTCVLEIKGDYIGVEFLDEHLRSYVSYQFQERKPCLLFLTMAVHRKFDGHQDKVVSGTVFLFKEDGRVFIEDHDYTAGTVTNSETVADVSTNWEAYPEVGSYDLISKVERKPKKKAERE